MTVKKATQQRQGFKTSEFIVYPAHGVGKIIEILPLLGVGGEPGAWWRFFLPRDGGGRVLPGT